MKSVKEFLNHVNYYPSIGVEGGVFSAISFSLQDIYSKYVGFCCNNGFSMESKVTFNSCLFDYGFSKIGGRIIIYIDCDTTVNSIDRFLKTRGYHPLESDNLVISSIATGSIYNDYKDWCRSVGVDAHSIPEFRNALRGRSFKLSKNRLPFSGASWDVYVISKTAKI